MPPTKPDLVILYTDPVADAPARLCYWQNPNPHHAARTIVEYQGMDALGEPTWTQAMIGGVSARTEVVLAHLMWHVLKHRNEVSSAGIIDLSEVKIPMRAL
jgi:hypothetical protein